MKKTFIIAFLLTTLTAIRSAETPPRHRRVTQLVQNLPRLELETIQRPTKKHAGLEFNDWAARYLTDDNNTTTEYIGFDLFPGVHSYLDHENVTITPPSRERTPEGTKPPATDFISEGYSSVRSLTKLTPKDKQMLYEFAALTCLKNALEQPYEPLSFERIAEVITTKSSGKKKELNPTINEIALLCRRMRIMPTEKITQRTKEQLREKYNKCVPEIRTLLADAGYTQSPIDLTPIK